MPGMVYISAPRMNTNSADATMEGRHIGKVMRMMVVSGVAPPMRAASSSEVFIPRRLPTVKR